MFITKGDIGIGTILGSAVFNVLFVLGLCGIVASAVWITRTTFYYVILSVFSWIFQKIAKSFKNPITKNLKNDLFGIQFMRYVAPDRNQLEMKNLAEYFATLFGIFWMEYLWKCQTFNFYRLVREKKELCLKWTINIPGQCHVVLLNINLLSFCWNCIKNEAFR